MQQNNSNNINKPVPNQWFPLPNAPKPKTQDSVPPPVVSKTNSDGGYKNILIGVLAFAVLALGGYVMFGKSDTSNNKTTQTAENKSGQVTSVANNNTARAIYMGAITGAYESSADREGNYVHSAKLAIDNNVSSCWSEGAPGAGIGENIIFQFNGNYEVRGFEIWPGHQKSQDLFYKNSRPRILRVEGSNGIGEDVHLSDSFGSQRIMLSKSMMTSSIRLSVISVYYGNKWQDTSISEIRFF